MPSSRHGPVYNYGSINIDYVYRVPHLVKPGETLASTGYRQVLGGKGANQSLALARAGGEVVHWGRVAQADHWVLAPLIESGVDTTQVEMTQEASGHALIQVDDDAENAIILYPGANQGFGHEQLESLIGAAERHGWLLMQNECNDPGRMIELAAARGLPIAFNPAPLSTDIAELPLAACQLLFLNRGEAAALVGLDTDSPATALLDALAQRWPDVEIVLTLGKDGVCHQVSGERLTLSAHAVDAVDTTAAGDTFIGYFMAARQRGEDTEQALRLASAASALCVQQAGAAPSIPEAKAVAEALKQWPPLAVETSRG